MACTEAALHLLRGVLPRRLADDAHPLLSGFGGGSFGNAARFGGARFGGGIDGDLLGLAPCR